MTSRVLVNGVSQANSQVLRQGLPLVRYGAPLSVVWQTRWYQRSSVRALSGYGNGSHGAYPRPHDGAHRSRGQDNISTFPRAPTFPRKQPPAYIPDTPAAGASIGPQVADTRPPVIETLPEDAELNDREDAGYGDAAQCFDEYEEASANTSLQQDHFLDAQSTPGDPTNDHADSSPSLDDAHPTGPMTAEELTFIYNHIRRQAAHGRVADVQRFVHELVQRGEKPNLRMYSALILTNIDREAGSAAEVKELFKEMASEGIVPDVLVYHDALKVLSVHPDCMLRGSIIEEMRKRWLSLTDAGWHDIAAGLLREGLVEQALETMDDMRKARVGIQSWLYDMVTYMLCDILEIDEALSVMQDRLRGGDLKSSAGAWYYLFDTACAQLHYDTIKFIWQRRVAQNYLNPTSGQCLQVLNAAARRGDIKIATDVFRILSKRAMTFESQHYELLIEAYVEGGDLRTALTIFCIMNNTGIVPSQSATSAIPRYLKQSRDRPQEAFKILEELKEDRAVPTEAINRIIEACIEHEGLTKGIEIYSSLHRICPSGPNVNTFNALFVGCRNEKRKDTAMFLAAEMLALQVLPNSVTFDRLILTCLEAGDVEDALRYYKEMREEALIPRSGTMAVLVQKCGEVNHEMTMGLLEDLKGFGYSQKATRNRLVVVAKEQKTASGEE